MASETCGGGDFAEGATDFGRAVQDEPPALARGRAGVDLVHERRAEEVGAVDRGHEQVVRGVEGSLIVGVGVVQADLRPGPDTDVVIVVRPGLEARRAGAGRRCRGVIDAEPVEEGAAIGETARRKRSEPTARPARGYEAGLQRPPRSSPAASLFMVQNRSPVPPSATVFAVQSAAFSLAENGFEASTVMPSPSSATFCSAAGVVPIQPDPS